MATNVFTGSVSSAWTLAANWSQTAVPTASDGFVTTLNGTSPACTLGSAGNCQSLDFTGYTNTFTMSAGLTVTALGAGTSVVTLGSGMTISGTQTLTIANNANAITFTGNGITYPGSLTFSNNTSSPTYTFSGTWQNTGLVRFNVTTGTVTCNGGTLGLGGNFEMLSYSTGTLVGTTVFQSNGSSGPFVSGAAILNGLPSGGFGATFEIANGANTAPTNTNTSPFVINSGGVLKYTSGVLPGGGTGYYVLNGGTLTTNASVTWNVIYVIGGTNTFNGSQSSYTIHNLSNSYLPTGNSITPTTATISLTTSQTLTVDTLLFASQAALTIQSATPGTAAALNYSGSNANMRMFDTTFTDINASGSTLQSMGSGSVTGVSSNCRALAVPLPQIGGAA
jgi:hypothetical protein